MIRDTPNKVKSRNFSLAFEKMCNFVAIANTRNANETLRQLILQCFVILPDERFETGSQIREAIDILFGLQIPEHWLRSIFDQLIEDGLFKFLNDKYILLPETKVELQKLIDEAITLEESVKNEWLEEIAFKFPTLSPDQAWSALRGYLTRAFRRHGIQTAALLDQDVEIAPEYAESLSFLLDDVLKDLVPTKERALIKEVVSMFFADVGNHPNRAKYITQLGDGAFSYFSLIVAPDTAEQLRQRLQPLTLFLDTNFLFGILDLHVNPLVDVSNQLLRSTEKYGFPFQLRYHEITEKEMRFTINHYRQILCSRNWSRALSRAATTTRCLSGIVAKYHQMNSENGIDPETFFKFYDHADLLLQNKNILVYKPETQNEKEIMELVYQYQKFLKKWNKEKPDEIVEHDMTVLNIVRKLRSNARSSIEAEALLITCDYLLYRFDWETSRQEGRLSCVVLPNLFWQILHPFIPSDLDFERSFAETFALPEFRTLGSGASEACSKLLCLLALYKDIPEETAARLLSNDLLIDGLRNIDDDRKFQEYVESAIAADNASLIEEKAAIARQLEIERGERNARERQLIEQRIKEQEGKERMEQALAQKEKELEGMKQMISDEKRGAQAQVHREKQSREEVEKRLEEEKKLRKVSDRVKDIYKGVFGAFFGFLLAGFFIYLVYEIPWTWLLKHQNSYGLQGAFSILILVSVLGLFRPKWRKVLWSVSLLAGIVFVVLSLLGGPK